MNCTPKKISEMTLTCKLLCNDMIPIVLDGENKVILIKNLIKLIIASIGEGGNPDALSIALYAKSLAELANANANQALKDLAVALAYATKAYKLACLFEDRLSALEENMLFIQTLEETINNLAKQVRINTINILKLFNSKILRIDSEENADKITYAFYMDDMLVNIIEVPKYKKYVGSTYIDVTNNTISLRNLAQVAYSGSYNDLLNKPNLKRVAYTGSYNDLVDKPDLEGLEQNIKNYIDNKYNDLYLYFTTLINSLVEDLGACCNLHLVTLQMTGVTANQPLQVLVDDNGDYTVTFNTLTGYITPIYATWAPATDPTDETQLTETSTSGNRYTFTLTGITQNVIIKAYAGRANTVSVYLNVGTGFTVTDPQTRTINLGASYLNTFTLENGYVRPNVYWKANNSSTKHPIDNFESGVPFTISNINLDITVFATAEDASNNVNIYWEKSNKDSDPNHHVTITYSLGDSETDTGTIVLASTGSAMWIPYGISVDPVNYEVFFDVWYGTDTSGQRDAVITGEQLLESGIPRRTMTMKWYLEEKTLYKFTAESYAGGNRGIFALGTLTDLGELGYENISLGTVQKLNSLGQYELVTDISELGPITIETHQSSHGREIELHNPTGIYIGSQPTYKLILPLKLYDLDVYSTRESFDIDIKIDNVLIGTVNLPLEVLEAPMFSYNDNRQADSANGIIQYGNDDGQTITYPNILIPLSGDCTNLVTDDSTYPTNVFSPYIAPLGTRNRLIVQSSLVTNNYTELDSQSPWYNWSGFKIDYTVYEDPVGGASPVARTLTLKVLSSQPWLEISYDRNLTLADVDPYVLPGNRPDGIKYNLHALANSGSVRTANIAAFLMSDNATYLTQELENGSASRYNKTITFKLAAS